MDDVELQIWQCTECDNQTFFITAPGDVLCSLCWTEISNLMVLDTESDPHPHVPEYFRS